MGTFDRSIFLGSFLGRIGTWLPHGWVWKRSPLGPLQTLLTVISMVGMGSKGYRAALRDVFRDMHEKFGWVARTPSSSAFTQAREKFPARLKLPFLLSPGENKAFTADQQSALVTASLDGR